MKKTKKTSQMFISPLIGLAFISCSGEQIGDLRALSSDGASDVQTTQQESSSSDNEDKSVSEPEIFVDEDVTLPGNIAGSFLTCSSGDYQVSDTDEKITLQINCAVVNDNKESKLNFSKKESTESKELMNKDFEFINFGAPVSGVIAETTKYSVGSIYDYKISLEAESFETVTNYIKRSALRLPTDQRVRVNHYLSRIEGTETQ